jgi:type II secretory pathway component PulC
MQDNLLTPLLTTEWGRRAGLATFIVTALLLLGTLIKMPLTWRADLALANEQASTAAQPFSKQMSALIEQIPEAHLFGRNGLADSISDMPITSLQLRLVGIVKSVPDQYSRALISEAGEPAKVYQIGDTLSSSEVRVTAITRNGVVLENEGHVEKLPLQRSRLHFQGLPKGIDE